MMAPGLCYEEILALPRRGPEDAPGQATPHILSAKPYSGRRSPWPFSAMASGTGSSSAAAAWPRAALGPTEDFLAAQASVLRAHLPDLSSARWPGSTAADSPTWPVSGRRARALAAVTGIPSRRDTGPDPYQNLDRLTEAAAGHRYAVLTVAEPLDPTDLRPRRRQVPSAQARGARPHKPDGHRRPRGGHRQVHHHLRGEQEPRPMDACGTDLVRHVLRRRRASMLRDSVRPSTWPLLRWKARRWSGTAAPDRRIR